ncbi:GNAT family N-acetyltransferase [Chryseobacterium sp. JUb7]|uniref:GNAT family N-acetyltransferase n=1 Tax=Chryseobacterium sp. JUb7 TaxID=2940599 RepID=UPI00216A4578|nr:GNAT family N-acetyltransferase [Chryseobacterium sp. JUb7]MCS3529731.1 GNAT superfamily N-acetyltransferase [Chryseobacterium sp. JUb7]
MIYLQTLNKKQLEEFVSSGDFKKHDFLPISEHRAKSQIKNPKADDDQPLLILAYDDDQLAGYLGCLPDNFNIDGKTFSYAWLSTLYVSHKFRGKRIAQSLLNRAFEEYNGNIAITEFTPEAESLYNKIGVFKYIQPKNGKRFYFRTELATIIPLKKPKTKSFQPLFSVGDRLLNAFVSLKNSLIKKPDFKFEILSAVDPESSIFISQFHTNRTGEEIKWIMQNPWILEGQIKEKKYLFSSFSESFRYFWIKVFDAKNNMTSCALLLERDGYVKIPYFFSASDSDQFTDFLSYFIVKHKVKVLVSYQAELNKKLENSHHFPKIHQRNMERRYMFHEQMLQHLPDDFDPKFQDGDGDCAMT